MDCAGSRRGSEFQAAGTQAPREWLEAWSVCAGGQKLSINYLALFSGFSVGMTGLFTATWGKSSVCPL